MQAFARQIRQLLLTTTITTYPPLTFCYHHHIHLLPLPLPPRRQFALDGRRAGAGRATVLAATR